MLLIYAQIEFIQFLDGYYNDIGSLDDMSLSICSKEIDFIKSEFDLLFKFEPDSDPLKSEAKYIINKINENILRV